MKQSSNPDEIQHFITGLKTVIRSAWPTQEEFAKGVTSKVNLSNILRGQGGTSHTMRQALAAKAGMSVEAISTLGKNVLNPQQANAKPTVAPTLMETIDEDVEWYGGSTSELMGNISDLTMGLQAELSSYAKATTSLVRNVINERDKLIKLLSQEQAIVNAMNMAIKVVNRDMTITYVNRVMMEKFQVTPGDRCTKENCSICGSCEGIVKQVLQTGKAIQKFIHSGHEWYAIEAFPIVDTAWLVTRVVVVISFGSDWWVKALVDQGWTPPLEEI